MRMIWLPLLAATPAFAQAPVIAHPAQAAPTHKAVPAHKPAWHAAPVGAPLPRVVMVQQPSSWGLGSWLAAPFTAIGTGVGYVAAGVGNVVEAPFVAVGNAWSNENCWRSMIDPHDGQEKLFWICQGRP